MHAHPSFRLVRSSADPAADDAALQQTLSETVASAERVYVTQAHDVFAAGVLAEAQLARTEHVTIDAFPDQDDQHRWRLAQTTLREAQRAARARPQLAQSLDDYRLRFDRHEALLAALGGEPTRHVRGFQDDVLAIDKKTPHRQLVASLGSLVPLTMLGWFGGLATALAVLGALGALVGAHVSWRRWRHRSEQRRHAQRELRAAWLRAAAYAAYLDDPEGGRWLRMVWERHPLLLQEAPAPAIPSSGVFPIASRSMAPGALDIPLPRHHGRSWHASHRAVP